MKTFMRGIDMGKYKSFIIHLQRATGRKAQVQDLIGKLPFEAEIVDAVDGAKLSQQDIDACFSKTPLLQPTYPFSLNPGEIGCFLSHRRVWQKIVDQDLAVGLVLEDDVQIDPANFGPVLAAAKQWVQDFGYIQFQVREVATGSPELGQIDGCTLLRPVPTMLRTSAQLVSNATARRLLDVTVRFDRPVDTLLQMHWETGVRPVCVVPSGVTDRTQETGGSTLSLKRPLHTKILREWKRFNYRRKVKSLSAKMSHKTA